MGFFFFFSVSLRDRSCRDDSSSGSGDTVPAHNLAFRHRKKGGGVFGT